MIEYRSLRVALLGGGTVGANVARRLIDHADELAARVGAHIDLIGVAVVVNVCCAYQREIVFVVDRKHDAAIRILKNISERMIK